MTDKNNRIKAEKLGMPYGTASNRLRKMILFSYVVNCGDNVCYQCGSTIDSIDDLSIEHKIAWLNNDPALFWDLDNIAFSHLSCNISAGDRTKCRPPTPKQRVETDTLLWCNSCKQLVSKKHFTVNNANLSKLEDYCKFCRSRKRSKKDKENGNQAV